MFAAFHGSCFHFFFEIRFHCDFVFELWTFRRLLFNFQKHRYFQIFISDLILMWPEHKILMISGCFKRMEGLCYEEQMVCLVCLV